MAVKPGWVPNRDGSFRFLVPQVMEIILSPRGKGHAFTFRLIYTDKHEGIDVPHRDMSAPIRCRHVRLRDAFEEAASYVQRILRQTTAVILMDHDLRAHSLRGEVGRLRAEKEFVDLLLMFGEVEDP